MSLSTNANFNVIKQNSEKGFHTQSFVFIEWLFNFLFQLLLSLVIFIFFPVSILLIFPFAIYRITVKYCAKVFRKDLSDMLSPRSNTFAADRITKCPKINIVFSIILEGDLDLKRIQSDFTTQVINNKQKDQNGKYRYQKLFQYIVNWGGYFFWKDDNDFDLSNHIKSLPDNIEHTEKDLIALNQAYLGRKWPSKRPLWEFVLMPNYTPSYSTHSGNNWIRKKSSLSKKHLLIPFLVITGNHVAMLFAVHHSISDAYSFFYFIINALCQKESHSNAVPTYIKRPWYSMLIYLITFPFEASWEIAGLLVKALKRNALDANKSFDTFQLNGSQGSNFNIAVTQSLPISLVKDVKSHYKTSFAAVQQSVLTGAVTEFHQEKGINLPRATPCYTILPYPGHKLDKFQNHA